MLTKMGKIFDRILEFTDYFAGAILLFQLGLVSVEVAARYFFNSPVQWALHISEIGVVYIVFLCTALVLRKGAHVRVETFYEKFSPRTRAVFDIIHSIMGAIIFLIVIWYGSRATGDHIMRGMLDWEPPYPPSAIALIVIPIGSFLLFIQFIRKTYKGIHDLKVSAGQQERISEVTSIIREH